VIGTFFLLCLGAVFIAVPWALTLRLTPETKQTRIVRWLFSWSLRGVGVPILLWALINIGLAWNLQPFMPEVQAARNRGGNWAPEYFHVVSLGLYFVTSYWSTLTLAWVLLSAARAVDDAARKDFQKLCVACLLGLCIPATIIFLIGGLTTAGLIGTLFLSAMAGYSRDILQPPKMPPMYARAIARMKFGKYSEAEWEIIKELENWEDDFDGWMMLADLYANHFNNMTEAEQTILEICSQPKTTSSQLAVALHRLADWHLKISKDPAAAKRALLMICERLQGTHLAHMAQLRINQLPASAAELKQQQTSQTIPLPALGDQMDDPVATGPVDREAAARTANAYVEQLKDNPNNVVAREKLARVLTERLSKPLLGIEQVQLLLDMPDRSHSERAGWLGLIAAWQIKYRHDLQNGQAVLERILREFPDTPQALMARRRLELLARELKQASP
jgi:hypothetical protein